ncbi:transposase [Kribbella amoyensis]|uniref:Transposase n=1 Tax=Kribbella amoyensis TaxID=996641 RepID=A0A561BS15_9ACTN|nr:IS481 family transposase [Kribbella amoyensis]TWD81671.1 transposase [Kribbella amoyensis]TWD83045.1 transposase [Kribbella amoyensis]
MLRELSVVEQRYQAVLAVVEDRLSVTEAAAKVGVSRQTLHNWLRRYAEQGLDGLADRSHRPVSCPHQMAAEVEVRLVELRQLHPAWGPDRLLYRLGRDGVEPLPSRAAVGRALARLGLVAPGRRRRSRDRVYRRWERGRPMELWQFDVMGGVLLNDGRELKAVTGVDDHSRFCVAAGLVERASTRPVCAVFAAALGRHGIPTQVLTDNGKVFTGRYNSRPVEVLFDRICRENGIEHILTAPRSPTTTGKIERFHGTLRRECLAGRTFASIAQAQAVIDAWVHEYNTDRPHQSIGRCTPAERFATRATDPGPALDLTALADRRTGTDWITRRVASNGVVCVAWQQVSVGKHRYGELVDVHVTDRILEFWSGNDLLRTVVRESRGEIRKKRAAKPAST